MITASIDVSKIDESRFRQHNGNTYMEIVLFEVKNGKNGNNLGVKQSSTKEEREKKIQLPFIGNGKDWNAGGNSGGGNNQRSFSKPAPKKVFGKKPDRLQDADDDLPY